MHINLGKYIRKNGKMVKTSKELKANEEITLKFVDGIKSAKIM